MELVKVNSGMDAWAPGFSRPIIGEDANSGSAATRNQSCDDGAQEQKTERSHPEVPLICLHRFSLVLSRSHFEDGAAYISRPLYVQTVAFATFRGGLFSGQTRIPRLEALNSTRWQNTKLRSLPSSRRSFIAPSPPSSKASTWTPPVSGYRFGPGVRHLAVFPACATRARISRRPGPSFCGPSETTS